MYGVHIYSLTVFAQIHKDVYPGEKLWSISGEQGTTCFRVDHGAIYGDKATSSISYLDGDE